MIPEPVHESDPTKRIELQQVFHALEELPEAQRLPIVLVALKDMSYADAARTLDVPLGTLLQPFGARPRGTSRENRMA